MENKIILFHKKEDCCGCTACANICPQSAIKMRPDGLGFLYPVIDEAKCIKCGLCIKVCSFNKNYDKSLNLQVPDVYAIQHKSKKEIEKSQSGAAFIVFSDYILNNDGIVYGVGYTEHFKVVHKRAKNKAERDEFRGSKYVQSDLNFILKKVKKDLKENKYVLFTGTPCQTAALRSYLLQSKVNTEKLFVIDLVCHGVPSPQLWNDYLVYLERKNKAKITKVNFRDKKFGWASHRESFQFNDTYTYLFYQHIMLRKSCGNCYFANLQRPSDITIGDYWGIEKIRPELRKENKGVSLVLINTEKGKKLFNEVKMNINYINTDINDCLQPNLKKPTTLHPKCEFFEKDYINYGFEYVKKRYSDNLFKYIFKLYLNIFKVKLVQFKNRNKYLYYLWKYLKTIKKE